MSDNLKKLEKWLNYNKNNIFDGKYLSFEGKPDYMLREGEIPQSLSEAWSNHLLGTKTIDPLYSGDVLSLSDILFDHSVAKFRWGEESGWDFDLRYMYELSQISKLPTEEERLNYFCKDL